MKYESSILKRLIDTYGVVGNPRYISEIIKEFIVQGKERFPNLFTYQADWLAHIDEFGLNPSYTVSYTCQSIYAPNTLERPVKSAILTGQTMVNLATPIEYKTIMYHGYCLVFNGSMLKSGEYTLKSSVDFSQYIINILSTQKDKPSRYKRITIRKNGVFTIDDTFFVANDIKTEDFFICLRPIDNANSGTTTTNEIENCEVILLEGDYTNVDIPYFEGMQSVKMPVLTTTGKNLFDTTIPFDTDYYGSEGRCLPCYYDNEKKLIITEGISGQKNSQFQLLKFKPNTTYTFSGNVVGHQQRFCIHNESKQTEFNGTGYFSLTVATGNSGRLYVSVLKVGTPNGVYGIENLQIEESSSATTYKPYKSNILTVNEPVELRGIGDVRDTLDLLTGEVTQRIGEIVLDGSENWVKPSRQPTNTSKFLLLDFPNNKNAKTLSNIRVKKNAGEDEIGIWCDTNTVLNVDTSVDTVESLKVFLSKNPINLQYSLATESIKTVDLNILDQNGHNIKQLMSFNGGTHFNTGSAEGSPLPVLSVSVETDLEETLRVCSLEGNTM